jgi:hypothetical protein
MGRPAVLTDTELSGTKFSPVGALRSAYDLPSLDAALGAAYVHGIGVQATEPVGQSDNRFFRIAPSRPRI